MSNIQSTPTATASSTPTAAITSPKKNSEENPNIKALTQQVDSLAQDANRYQDMKFKAETIAVGLALFLFFVGFVGNRVAARLLKSNKDLLIAKSQLSQIQLEEASQKSQKLENDLKDKEIQIGKLQNESARIETEGKARIAEVEATANQKIEEARAQADVKIADAKAIAAIANEKAEAERLTRIKLEESLAPIHFDVTSEAIGELRLFEGTKFVILWTDGSLRLAAQINEVMSLAGWDILRTPVPYPEYSMDYGVKLFTKSAAEVTDSAAEVLSYQLKDSKIETQHTREKSLTFWPQGLPDDAVIIHVGIMRNRYFDDRSREKRESQLDEPARQRLQKARREEEEERAALLSYDPQKRRQLIEKQRELLKSKPQKK